MNLSLVLVLISLGAAFSLFVAHYWKLRLLLFSILMFLSMARLPLGSSDESSLSLRLPLVFVILLGSYRSLPNTMDQLYKKRLLGWATLWFLYVGLFWFYSSGTRVSIYEHLGNYIFFLLTASVMSLVNRKELGILVILIALTQIPGVLLGIRELRPYLIQIGFNWGTVYHQRSAQAGVYLLPILLLWLDRMPGKNKVRLLLLISSILALFVIVVTTGARTPSLVFGLVLIYWLRRKVKYIFLLILITIAGLYFAESVSTEETTDRYVRAYGAIASGNLNEAANVEFRYEHLKIGLRAFAESPLFGHGHNSWMGIIGREKGILGYNLAPHNEVIRLIVEYGFIGLVIFVMFILKCSSKIPKKATGNYFQAVRYTLAVITFSMVFLNFFHNSLFTRHFFFLLGASAGLYINRNNPMSAILPVKIPAAEETGSDGQ